jgi:hypothetical protein
MVAAAFGVRELAPAVAAEAVTRKSHTGWLGRGRKDGGGPPHPKLSARRRSR